MICEHCNESVEIRNPSGYCDHLYYPDYCDVCKARQRKKQITSEFDFDNFIYIGSKIADKIYEIPKDDLEWFKKAKHEITEALAIRYRVKELQKDIKILEG